ncbi:unnamed protein product [Cuscuta campestris]|uniref:Retrotransposon gag domain-containing protein n=1 Tax=Cuscuta campestris TaxID=132261 RepID=A0A484LAI2_9ASTE|nr:unnamed protein product [Cuscuta campestris]
MSEASNNQIETHDMEQNAEAQQDPVMPAFLTQFLQQMANARMFQPPPPPPPRQITLKMLKDNGAEEFHGNRISDPQIALDWIEQTERVLKNLSVPDARRPELAFLLLRKGAYEWWKRVDEKAPKPWTWEHFDWAFKKEYIPARFREEKCTEFMELKQGDMTLPELRQKFNHLAQFPTTLVSTPADRIEEFCKRLRPDIRPYVSTLTTTDFSKAYDLMAKAEKDVDDYKASLKAEEAGPSMHPTTHPAPLGAVNPVFAEDSLFGSVRQVAENEGDSICVNLPLRTSSSSNVSQGDKDIVLEQTQFVEGTVTEAIDKPESVESRGNSNISSCSLVNEGAYIDSLKGRKAVAGRHDQVHKLLSPFAKEFIPQSNSFSTLSHLGTEENVLVMEEDPFKHLNEKNLVLHFNALEERISLSDEPIWYNHSDDEDAPFFVSKLRPLAIDLSRCSKISMDLPKVFKRRKLFSPSQIVTRSKAKVLSSCKSILPSAKYVS